jgi:Zn-dependent protease
VFTNIYAIIALLVGLSFHEAAHAYVAWKLGDHTAKRQGRVSLNPLRHLLVLIGIGWGKPVPVDERYLLNPKRDGALVALAGPISNIILAVVFAVPFKYLQTAPEQWMQLVRDFSGIMVHINVLLFALNILPFPPLDGSKILGLFVPYAWQVPYRRFLKNGMKYFFIIILVDVIILRRLFGVSILQTTLFFIMEKVEMVIFLGT